MSWNFLQVVELGASSAGLYPVPTAGGLGFETTDGDVNAIVVQIAGVKVIRAVEDGWEPSLNVLRTKGRLFISDHRVAVTFDKFVPKDQSSFRPIALVRADGTKAKRPKQMVVGHVGLTQIRQVGLRGAHAGKSTRDAINEGLGSLIIAATDATDTGANAGPPTMGTVVAIEIIVADGVEANGLANGVLTRVMRAKTASALDIDHLVRSAWIDMSRVGFTAGPGEVQTYEIDPSELVRSPDAPPNTSSRHLIPPTDTSPVPTMQPTPAFPMPALASTSAAITDPPTMTVPSSPTPAAERTLPAPQPTGTAHAEPSRSSVFLPAPPPPGSIAEWRSDPFARFDLRFWDGFGWTEHVHANGEQTTDPPR